MKKLSYKKMADTIIAQRKEQKLTQAQLAEKTGKHRGMISRIEDLDNYLILKLYTYLKKLNQQMINWFSIKNTI